MMMQDPVDVVSMQWLDLIEVAALEVVTYPDDAWSQATWWAELAGRPRRHYLVARSGDGVDGAILGYAGIDITGENADVMTIAVAPQQRRTGLGSVLLARMHDAALQAGASAMLLEVRADNAEARALYARHEYEQIATRAGYYGGVDAIVMRRALPGRGASNA